MKPVPVWPDSAYSVFVRAETDGMVGHTHLALLSPPDAPACRGYVKHFVNHGTERCLFNEWFCHHLLQALGVAQPHCALMRAPIMGTGPLAWAFVSCEPSPVNHGTPKQIYSMVDAAQLKELARRLLQADMLPRLIAADQLIANPDRNLGNLVFTGKRTFVAIDHSNALHGPAWKWGDLWWTQKPVRSVLTEFVRNVAGPIPVAVANALVAAADVVQEAYYAHQVELRSIMDASNSADTAAVMDMTWWRCDALGRWFRIEHQVI